MKDQKAPSAEAKAIITRLQKNFSDFNDPFDVLLISIAADNLLTKGWVATEIYSFFSNFEEVDPGQDEDVAISAMQRIEQRVEKRLQETTEIS